MQIVCRFKNSVKISNDMKSWPTLGPCILGFDKLIVYFIHNIGGMGCNYNFNNYFHDLCDV